MLWQILPADSPLRAVWATRQAVARDLERLQGAAAKAGAGDQ